MTRSNHDSYLMILVRLAEANGWSGPVQLEYKFHPHRKWRADLCFVAEKLIIEVEGGIWTGGRHTSGAGFTKDIEKYNVATAMGYRILRASPSDLRTHPPKFIWSFLHLLMPDSQMAERQFMEATSET
jgi:very-short-patch-repair endonuclease